MNSDQSAASVHVMGSSSDAPPPNSRRFVWNMERVRLEEVR
jgi:hypothetical protein